MSIQRRLTTQSRSPRELLTLAGKLPACLAASAIAFAMPITALAQPAGEGAPAVRDPMKPAKDGADKPVVKVSDHNTVDLHVKDEDLANVLQLLSMQTQKNIIASKNVSARVTATLYGVTFYEALDSILHVNGFGYLEKGNFIYVYTNEELKQIEAALKKRVAKCIKLNYLNSTDAKTFAEPLLSKDGGQIQTAEKTANFNIPDKSPTGKDDFALTATLVVIDYEENIKAVEDLLKQLDTRPAQVLIEATILQTSLNEQNAFGIDFSIIGDLKFTDFINIGGPLGAANGLIKGGSGGASSGLSPSDNQGTAVVSAPGNTSGPGTFKVGVVAGDVSIFLRLLDTITDTVILSNPKILTLNRQPARVLVGTRVGYLSTTATETSTTQTVEFLDTGTQLYFRPFVSSEGDVRMELKPQVSAAEIRTVTDANGAAVTIPDEVTQELVTNVNVRDGQTVVLGGLFTDNQTYNRRQVPWLGDIPIIGSAFRGNDDTTKRSEIIFLVTPTIVTDQTVAAAADKAQGDMERLRAGARQGLLPWSRDRMTAQLNVEAERLAREGQYDKALWNIQRSLSLNSHQSEAYRLRERITGERENWPNPNHLDNFYGDESNGIGAIKPSTEPQPHYKPWGSTDIERRKVSKPGDLSANYNYNTDPFIAALMNSNADSLQGQLNTTFVEPTASTAEPVSQLAVETTKTTAMTPGVKGTPVVKPNTTTANNPTPTTSPLASGATSDAQAQLPADADFKSTTDVLQTTRTALTVWVASNDGFMPALGTTGGNGWDAMIENGLIAAAPRNSYVSGPNADKVVIGFKPDAKFHQEYGWIFNPETGQLWAAGFDANDKPLSKTPTQTANMNTAGEPTSGAQSTQNSSPNQSQTSVTVEDLPNQK